jgi:hypothetical protein
LPRSALQRAAAFGTCFAVLVAARSAGASPSCAAGDRDCGRAAFNQGTADFDRGAYASAIEWFRAAEAAEPHPVIAFNLALSYARLGKPVTAEAELGRLLAAPEVDAALRARIEAEHNGALAQIAHVNVETPEPGSYSIDIDGARADLGSGELALDPGVHHVLIASGATPVYEQDVTLQPGERLRLRVTSRARSIDVVVVPSLAQAKSTAVPAETPAPAPPKTRLSPVVFYAAAGATVALGAVTIWSGLDVKSAYDSYKADLPHLSPAEAESRVESGHGRERRTNILLAVTAVSATATTLLGFFWVDFKPSAKTKVTGALTPFSATVSAEF